MSQRSASSLLASLGAVLLAAGVAWAGSQGTARLAGVPVFAICVTLAFAMQWVAFVPSALFRTERYYDLTGSVTYISVALFAFFAGGRPQVRTVLLLLVIIVWAGRLGAFLYRRVRRAGKDSRFDSIKRSVPALFMTWTLQGLWVSLTLATSLAVFTTPGAGKVDGFMLAGFAVWLLGFSTEAIADAQKSRFRRDPANAGAFITTGLWSVSRHPNYLGEIVLWTGVAILAVPALEGWTYVTLISPVFVYLLLTRVSGVPLLEQRAEKTWGGQPAYEAYKAATPVLFPSPGRRRPLRRHGSGTE